MVAGQWRGSRWVASSAPPLPDDPNPVIPALFGITCASAHVCVAVGSYNRTENSPAMPLIERWNGAHWSVQPAPLPAPPAGYRRANDDLLAVSCPTTSLCFAVGKSVGFGAGNAPGRPLIERWNGQRWSVISSPRGAAGPLTAISCTSARACTAVGGYENEVGTPEANNQHKIYVSTIERWNGQRWTIQSFPDPPGAVDAIMLGVDCTSATACVGVGSATFPTPIPGDTQNSTDRAMLASWNGVAWSTGALGFPSDPLIPTQLLAVSCATASACATVGADKGTYGGPLASYLNGTSWTSTLLHHGTAAQLNAISCPMAGWCMAFGDAVAERYTSGQRAQTTSSN